MSVNGSKNLVKLAEALHPEKVAEAKARAEQIKKFGYYGKLRGQPYQYNLVPEIDPNYEPSSTGNSNATQWDRRRSGEHIH